MIRSEQLLSPEALSFHRLPSYTQANIINRANSIGVDYIALFQAEQRQSLCIILPPDLSSQRNVESCTENARMRFICPSQKEQMKCLNGRNSRLTDNSDMHLLTQI